VSIASWSSPSASKSPSGTSGRLNFKISRFQDFEFEIFRFSRF